jgi:hypothetical protein
MTLTMFLKMKILDNVGKKRVFECLLQVPKTKRSPTCVPYACTLQLSGCSFDIHVSIRTADFKCQWSVHLYACRYNPSPLYVDICMHVMV